MRVDIGPYLLIFNFFGKRSMIGVVFNIIYKPLLIEVDRKRLGIIFDSMNIHPPLLTLIIDSMIDRLSKGFIDLFLSGLSAHNVLHLFSWEMPTRGGRR